MHFETDPTARYDAMHAAAGDYANPLRLSTFAETTHPVRIRGDTTAANEYVYEADDLLHQLEPTGQARNPLNPAQTFGAGDLSPITWPGSRDTPRYIDEHVTTVPITHAEQTRRMMAAGIARLLLGILMRRDIRQLSMRAMCAHIHELLGAGFGDTVSEGDVLIALSLLPDSVHRVNDTFVIGPIA
jgi:hypothetical protein